MQGGLYNRPCDSFKHIQVGRGFVKDVIWDGQTMHKTKACCVRCTAVKLQLRNDLTTREVLRVKGWPKMAGKQGQDDSFGNFFEVTLKQNDP